jgi:hypothetical protein
MLGWAIIIRPSGFPKASNVRWATHIACGLMLMFAGLFFLFGDYPPGTAVYAGESSLLVRYQAELSAFGVLVTLVLPAVEVGRRYWKNRRKEAAISSTE